MGPLIPLFSISGDICAWFQSQDGFPHLHASLPVQNIFPIFICSVTPVDHLAASMVAEQFGSMYQRFISGVTPADHLAASMAAEQF